MTEMLIAQRHELLVRELEASGVLRSTELAARLGVSRATVIAMADAARPHGRRSRSWPPPARRAC